MGEAVTKLKVFGLALVATFLIFSVTGFWGILGANGPLDGLVMLLSPLVDYPQIGGILVIVVGFIIIADRIAG